MNITKASQIGENIRGDMSRIFVDGFYQWLTFFSKDKEKMSKAFAHMFVLDRFHVAMEGDELAGFAACSNNTQSSVKLNGKELRKHLGLYKGTLASLILKKQFEAKEYPFDFVQGMGSVEFVAVDSKFRGRGVATSIIENIHKTEPYDEFVLEVADTNEKALNLYKKIGYKEFMRVPEKYSKQSGVNNYLYMKYGRP